MFSRHHSDDLVLPPLPSKQSKQQTVFILLPGCQLQPQQYESVASELQKAFDQAVWVAIPKLPFDMANPLVAPKAMKDALRQLQKQGYEGDKVFVGGYSLGGVFLPYVFDEKHGLHQDQVQGTIQLGSFQDRKTPNNSPLNKKASLTLTGDLDGIEISSPKAKATKSNFIM
jgi:hypothetical protein